MERTSWDDTWLKVASAVAGRSDCRRRQIGAVIVDGSNRIIATGYNGPPAGMARTCDTCPRSRYDGKNLPEYSNCISIHAEANALLFCDRRDRVGGRIYTTSPPCIDCAKLIANSGLLEVIILEVMSADMHRFPEVGKEILIESGVGYTVWTPN